MLAAKHIYWIARTVCTILMILIHCFNLDSAMHGQRFLGVYRTEPEQCVHMCMLLTVFFFFKTQQFLVPDLAGTAGL